MTQSKNLQGYQAYTIHSDSGCEATFIPERGGVGASIIMQGEQGPRELLFQHDTFWDATLDDLPGGWPICFPVCARLARQGKRGVYLYDHTYYHLDIHGFAWQLPWSVSDAGADYLIMTLEDTADTRACYPFAFQLRFHYTISDNLLTCRFEFTNHDHKAMPYYAGFHPYFLTPPAGSGKEAVILDYQPTKQIIYNDDLTDIIREQSPFSLPSSITNPEINEKLTVVGDDKLARLQLSERETLLLEVTGDKDPDLFPYMQLYTIPDQPFFCVEPWMGFPNALNSVSGARRLAPGDSDTGTLRLRLAVK